jgi:DNA-directed RNA polymerase specialized sigma24 family protein
MDWEGSVTCWIDQLKAGDQDAARPVWERYFSRLVTLARKRLQGTRRAAVDEEDVALSAFDSFCRAAEQGRFPKLEDRDDLWRLLVVITERKALDLARDQRRQKRGGGIVLGESGLGGLAQLPAREPTPAFAALMAEQCQLLLDRLGDEGLRSLALLKMEGYTNEEIARKQGCALRTVERKLGLIRSIWEEEGVA